MPIIAGGVVEKDGKFLLVQEAKASCRGKWNIPAGHLDAGETIIEAAKREVLEETGCTVEPTGIVHLVNKIAPDDVFMNVIFATKLLDEHIQYDTNEILDVKWFTYEEIVAMRDELRGPDWIMDAIDKVRAGDIVSLGLLKIY